MPLAIVSGENVAEWRQCANSLCGKLYRYAENPYPFCFRCRETVTAAATKAIRRTETQYKHVCPSYRCLA